jgi:predicted transcriptional regulator
MIEEYVSKEKKSVILLDRIDYIIIHSSFDSLIANIYQINDIVKEYNCLLLIRIIPSLLNKNQIAILKEEIQEIPERKIDDIQLDEGLFDILKYIQNEAERNILVSYSRIGKKFSISKITTKKRIDFLEEKGLIISKKQGRIKILYITSKGKNLLNRRFINKTF